MPASRAPTVLLLALAACAAAGLAASAVPPAFAVAAWCAAAGYAAWEWRRRPPVTTLTATLPDRLLLGLRDGTEVAAVLRRWRALGPLLWLDAAADDRSVPPLLIWQPALQMNAGRRLRRMLAAMRPAADGSV